MPRYRMTIAYEGTSYAGWQVQDKDLTIQECIERVLEKILQKRTVVVGSGRTDSGVHALGQVAHFDTEKELTPHRFLHALNSLLPSDIRILSLEEVDPNFHARFTAKRKIYHYHLHLDPIRSPFKRKVSHHLKGPCDLALLKKALPHFVGTRDFRSFTNEAKQDKSTVRTLYRLEVFPEEGGLRLEFEGNGFLYKMVRNIVGTLIEVAQSKIPIEALEKIFEQKDRAYAGQVAPPEGLFLVQVIYQD